MASDRPPISLLGFLAGLVSGLGISAALALYLTHAPVPFVNKVQQATENVTPESVDPNRPLFSPQIPSAQPDATAPGAQAPAASAGGEATASAPPAAGPTPTPIIVQPPPPPPVAAAADAAGESSARVMLQVGAYRSADDADAVRARLALLGLDGKVFSVTADGTTLYRVRLGPYGQLDDVNGIRRTLSDNGMEAQLVHVH